MIAWYGCGKEVDSRCELWVMSSGLRVTGFEIIVLKANYLMHDCKLKKSVAADNFICY